MTALANEATRTHEAPPPTNEPAKKRMTLADVMEGDDDERLPGDSLAWICPGASRGGASGKLLFLDVDGVLNTSEDPVDRESPEVISMHGWPCVLSLPRLRTLKAVLDRTGADVVLSSNWRLVELGCATLERGLRAARIPCARVVGATPDLRPHGTRQDEIRAWLRDNCGSSSTPIQWVAVDDMPLEREEPMAMRGHCVLTDAATGLDTDAAHACERLLNASTTSTGEASE